MSKLGCLPRIIIALVVVLALLAVGGLLFKVPQPEVHLSANYGGGSPEPFFKLGPIYGTGTLITSWITVVTLLGLFYLATRKMKLVPRGLQNIMEFAIEMLLNFVEGVAGKQNGRRFFPVVATIFLFVVTNAWLSLLPAFGTIGRGHVGESETMFFGTYSGFMVNVPLLRAANTDINVPLALALTSFVFVEYWGISTIGLRHYLAKFFRFGALISGLGQLVRGRVKSAFGTIMMGVIDAFAGGIELLSEFIRLVSFTFRLFGNMTAGEILLMMMAFIIPWVVPVAFYGLETLMGFIQALIFAGLTLVFATLAVARHGDEH